MREPILPPSLFKMDHFQTTGRFPLWVKSRHCEESARCPLCPIADIPGGERDIRFVPKADIHLFIQSLHRRASVATAAL
jgi:hypothetical protein